MNNEWEKRVYSRVRWLSNWSFVNYNCRVVRRVVQQLSLLFLLFKCRIGTSSSGAWQKTIWNISLTYFLEEICLNYILNSILLLAAKKLTLLKSHLKCYTCYSVTFSISKSAISVLFDLFATKLKYTYTKQIWNAI